MRYIDNKQDFEFPSDNLGIHLSKVGFTGATKSYGRLIATADGYAVLTDRNSCLESRSWGVSFRLDEVCEFKTDEMGLTVVLENQRSIENLPIEYEEFEEFLTENGGQNKNEP